MQSPSGKRVVESTGPLKAEIVLVGESPTQWDTPLGGPAETLLNKALVHSGIDRSQCRFVNCVPVRAPQDKFIQHPAKDVEWGKELFEREITKLTNAKVFVGLGPIATEWLLNGKPPVAQWGEGKREGFIGAWRGSILPVQALRQHGAMNLVYPKEEYLGWANLTPLPSDGVIIPTYHPAAVLRQFAWHPWFLLDLGKVASVQSNGLPKLPFRTWYRNDPKALTRLAQSDINMISVDTEMSPWIVGLATDTEVHVFEYDERYRAALVKLLTNPDILKVAHRWLHDYAFIRKCLEIEVVNPLFDSIGGAMALNGALEKQLSPHISTRFTNWPYHKWLGNIDQLHYCGMDSVVCYDAYWPMMQQMAVRGLVTTAGIVDVNGKKPLKIVDYDHKLLMPLMEMQAKGFRIDEVERVKVENELEQKLKDDSAKLVTLVDPVVEAEIKKFHKPHLFRTTRKCSCCGGGSLQRAHCLECGRVSFVTDEDGIDWKATAKVNNAKSIKVFKESLPSCSVCNGTGKVIKKLDFNPDSPDQVADVIYRGLKIRPRKYKGVETIKAAQLDPLRDKHPIIASVVDLSNVRADYDAVARLRAGSDGLLHCEFDPWGTESGRIAGKEGLVEVGTNAMNLPKEARRFVIPREGYEFIYPDMAQIEARAMAVLSKDKSLRAALYDILPDMGKPDYHTWLLRAMHDYDSDVNITRDQSKRVSYAGFYGARPEQLAKELTAEAFRKGEGQVVTAEMATRILQTLYRVCPEVPRWQNHACEEVLRTRKLKSITGREFNWVGYITDTKSGELDYEIKKQVWSRIPQDMGAYVLGLGLIDLYYDSGEWGRLVTPLVHCHDALLIEVPKGKKKDGQELAVSTLNRYIWGMDFPAEVKDKPGVNWYVVS